MTARGMNLRFFPGQFISHVDRSTLAGFLRHQYNWGFHAPFVRGSNSKAEYSFLFPQSILGARLCSPMIVLGYTALVIQGWWRVRPMGLLTALPLILLGKLSYVRGVLHGTRALLSGSPGIIADKRAA